MKESVEKQILAKMKTFDKGTIFFVEDFLLENNADTVRKALERLVKKGLIARVARGIYVCSDESEIAGIGMPTLEQVAVAIAERDKARIVPTGIYALNRLGLSTQVPMNVVYLTDGTPRKIKIYGRNIKFKKTSPKNLGAKGSISQLAIQALRSIGSNEVTEKEISYIQLVLKNESLKYLEHDFQYAPNWIKEIFRPVLMEMKNEPYKLATLD